MNPKKYQIIFATGNQGKIREIKEIAKRRMAELCPTHITPDDILSSINYLLCLSHGIGSLDDIDHLIERLELGIVV